MSSVPVITSWIVKAVRYVKALEKQATHAMVLDGQTEGVSLTRNKFIIIIIIKRMLSPQPTGYASHSCPFLFLILLLPLPLLLLLLFFPTRKLANGNEHRPHALSAVDYNTGGRLHSSLQVPVTWTSRCVPSASLVARGPLQCPFPIWVFWLRFAPSHGILHWYWNREHRHQL